MFYTFILVFGDGICADWILVERILAVPASSAPAERVYSNSGLIVCPHHAKMSDKLLKSLCLPSVTTSADCCDGQCACRGVANSVIIAIFLGVWHSYLSIVINN